MALPGPSQSGLNPLTAYSLVDDETMTEDAFRIIDEEVKRHSDFILSLKTRRNAFSPISKLPPELLSRIFGFMSEDRRYHFLSWIKVSYVCRTWRNVALTFPSLWTKLPITHRRWTEEMLSRSKNASLTVEADYASMSYLNKTDERIAEALSHSSRIRHLTLTNFDSHRMKKYLSNMAKQAPRLETLRLSAYLRGYDIDDPSPCEVSSELLATADGLRHFEVEGITFDWDSITSESLTRLKVHNVSNHAQPARPTMSQFWTALKKMPLLESLDLMNALPDPFTPESAQNNSARETIHFAHLQSLIITSSTPEVEDFLRTVSCPPTATIAISCKGTPVTLQDFTGLISWISSTLLPSKKSRGLNIRSASIQTPSPGRILRFKAFSDVLADVQLQDAASPKLDLSLTCPATIDTKAEEVVNKMLADVFYATPLQGLVSLCLDQGGSLLSARTLTETFGTLPQLRSVYVVGPIAANLVKALGETLPSKRSTRSNHAQRPSFPALRSLSMFNVDLEYDLDLNTLRDVIKARKTRGAEIRELKLQKCSRIFSDNVGELEGLVPKFIWDRVEMGYSDEDYSEDLGYGGYYDDESDIEYEDYYDVFFPF